jgi:hypothetical protein
MMRGGVAPGGICLTAVCEIAVTCAVAASIAAPGWKKILMTEMPGSDWLSTCSMSLTVVVSPRSKLVTMRRSISVAERPP